MRTGVGRTKDNLKKWGKLEGTKRYKSTCEYGMEQTMKHMQCPICLYSYSKKDVINANDIAIDIARFLAETN